MGSPRLIARAAVALGALALVLGAVATLGRSEPVAAAGTIIDGHIHYNREAWGRFPAASVMARLRKLDVRGFVSSTPDEGTMTLYRLDPQRVIPVMRPYRTDADRGVWTRDPEILAYVESRVKKGLHRGIGEFHLGASQVDDPVPRGFVQLAHKHGIFLHAHTGSTGIVKLAAIRPDVRVIWAHTGLGEGPESVEQAMRRAPNVTGELSLKDVSSTSGRLEPAWRRLFLQWPDRFILGSDTWINPQWANYEDIVAEQRRWLGDLPATVREKIARKNAERLAAPP